MERDLFAAEIVKMILNELNGSGEVRLIKLVRNVPTNRTELASLLTTQPRQLRFYLTYL